LGFELFFRFQEGIIGISHFITEGAFEKFWKMLRIMKIDGELKDINDSVSEKRNRQPVCLTTVRQGI